MDSENLVRTESLADVISEQAAVLLSMLSRPVVVRQIIIAIIIVLFAWLFSRQTQQWRARRQSSDVVEPANPPLLMRLYRESLREIVTPLLALVLLNIAIWVFEQLSYPKGLLEDLTTWIIIWLVYRIIVTLLRVRFDSEARPFRNRIVTPIFLFLLFIQFLAIWPGTVALAQFSIKIGTLAFPFVNLVLSLIVLYVFIITAWLIEQLMELTLPQRLNIESGLVESVATLTRYSILAIGIIVSLSLLGLNFTSLAIVAGGLSVGIGIGLQDIVANFVSGIVLLFEQSLRPGDVIELDGRISQVERISLRATVVRTRTNEEVIIPNAAFTTQQIKNLTKSERLVQVIVPVSVSYHSNPEIVRKLTVETSLNHPLILHTPEPQLVFKGYGESSLDFNLLVSIDQPELSVKIKSDLYYMLWQTFAENDITIPFPQRDLNLGDGWDNLVAGMQGSQ
ncbi:MAG: mechanosensitive ion channel [Anaerolineae bacterium]|nr:mechanosensitive ion channel [Anaerolineae bacterium]MCO5192871.1 mechanosensitive ion channel [Anaerolineae bacterium]MCO5205275.1 mechanosensitive ion channel [Anaerolineae bacterium]